MPVIDYYRGKSVFITGCTGFLGKVVLEKYLRALPELKKIYVLIRNKKGSPPIERFKKEILGSQCFDKLRKMHKNFDEYVSQKIHPVAGDILKDGLDMNAEDMKMLVENVNVVIHSAASVDFTARLDIAIQVNVRGTLRMFELSRTFKHIENFIHISTCYVNSDKRGFIDEKVYDIDGDAESIISSLEKIPVNDLEKITSEILGSFPNTYTFTKSMAERIVKKRALGSSVTTTILRPSIIGCSWREPYLGWVDTVSAAGAVYLLGGIGLVKSVEGDTKNIADQIPVDFVADMIIVAAATYANTKQFRVMHSSTSHLNPVTWGLAQHEVVTYWNEIPPEKPVSTCTFKLVKDPRVLKAKHLLRRVPAFLYLQAAKVTSSYKMKKNANRWNKMLTRAEQIGDGFKHFTKYEWIYETERIHELAKFCTPAELKIFQLDVTTIEWRKFHQFFCWGLQRQILKENVDMPEEPDHRNLLQKKDKTYFSDIKWAYVNGADFSLESANQSKSYVITSPRVQEAIKVIVSQRKDKGVSEADYTKFVVKKAGQLFDEMASTYSMPVLRAFAWAVHKVLKQVYEKVVVDENSLEILKRMDTKAKGPLVLIPTHRSYMDFIVVSYIFFAYGIKCPHIAAAEDFRNIAIVHRLLRSSGAFFIRRRKIEFMDLYKTIMHEYVQRLLINDSSLEFFIEGTRSRSGKTLAPKFGLMNIVAETYFDKKIPDVQIVPITINYERVLEGETFPFELLGEDKVKESLSRIVRAATILTSNFGRVYVEFSEPISMKEYTQNFIKDSANIKSSQIIASTKGQNDELMMVSKLKDPANNKADRMELISKLSYHILHTINDRLVIMPTSVVASLLLMHRKGITEENLINRVEWLTNELIMRGAKIGTINESGASVAVRSAISHLEKLVNRKKDIFHPSVSAKADYKNVLLLSYYRNMLIHVFHNEAICACAIVAFGKEMAWKEGVHIDRLWEEVSFLQKLIEREYVIKHKLEEKNFRDFIDTTIQNGVLAWVDNKPQEGKLRVAGNDIVTFLCNLMWPFIETYWITLVFMFSLRNIAQNTSEAKFLLQVQWFAESMYEERVVEFYESCSQESIKNAIHTFSNSFKVIKLEKTINEKTSQEEDAIRVLVSEEVLKGLEDHIQKFMKNSFAKTVSSPIEVARKLMLVDYPFMAKL